LRDAAAVAWASLRLTLVPIAAAVAILSIWASVFAGLYTRDPNLRASMAAVIPLVGCVLLVDCVGFIIVGSLRSLRETAWPTGIEIGSMLLLVPMSVSLSVYRGFGAQGLFLAMLTAGIARAGVLVWRFWWRTRGGTILEPSAPMEKWSLHAE